MKSKHLLLMLLLALLAPWAANGQSTLTVCDGTSTSNYAPIKGSGGTQTEFVYPASMLEEMEGGTITSVKFFSSSTATTNYTNTVTVYVEEVEGTTESTSAWLYSQSTATMVYEGTTLSVSDGELVITFSTPFVYNGGNLCFNIWSASSTPSVSYYCVNSTSSCAYDYYITPPVSTPYSTASSLPKVEFTYTPSTTSCEKPETLEATNITTNTALLVWGGASGTFNVEYKKSTETDYSVFASNVGQNVLLYNLDPATTYNVRVQRVCGGEVSSWKNTTFSTACGVINTFPVSYGFETSEGFPTGVSSYSAPTTNNLGNCWRNEATSQTGSSAARLWCTGTSSHSGSQSLMLPDKNNFNTTMLVFPAMNFTSANGYIVTFWISRNATGSNPEGFKVYASDCDTIGANAVELGHYSRNYNIAYPQIESSAGWYYYETDPIMMTGTTYIIFEGQSYYGNATYVDDVTIKIAPTCFIPTEAHADVADANNATISWTPDPLNAAGGSYSILDAEHNVVPGADQLTGTSFSLSGLNPETEYTYYVRTNCFNSEENVDLVEVAFSTPADCAAPVLGDDAFTNVSAHQATVSWTGFSSNTAYIVRYRTAEYLDGITEDFNETSSLPTGWAQYTAVLDNVLAGTATLSSGSSWTRTSTGLGAYNWKINVWNTKNAWMVTPSVPVPANGTLSFDVALTAYNGDGAPSSGNMPTANSRFVVLVSNSDLATWTILREWNNTGSSDVLNDISNTGNTFSVDLSAYENDNVRVAFYIEHSGSGDSDFHLDNVAIGTTIPAGIWQTVSPNPTTTSTTLTDLTAETSYDVKVNGICTGTQEETGSAIQSFTTTIACPKPNTLTVAANAVDPTTKEDLTWVMTGAETDWQISCLNGAVENITDINESAVSINPTTHEVSYTLSGLTPGQNYTVKVRANCEASVPGDQTSDWSNTQNFQTEATCVEPTAFDHGTVDAHNAPLSWTEAGTATQWQICINDDMDHLILISNTTTGVTVEGQNVSYTLTGLTAETAYTVMLRAYCADGDGNQSPWVTTSFTTLVACPAPTNLQVEANALDATFSWEGEAGSYVVVTSMNSSDNPNDLVSTPVTGNNYIFTNLELGNHYFWVRSNCSANGEGYSSWAGPVSVHIGYCVPNPTSHDGSGITGVSFGMGSNVVENGDGTTSLPASSPYYGDYSSMIGAVQAGVESTISITTATGNYPYTFVIWVDLDNSLSFEDSEVLYVGKAASGAGTHNATITIPATQATGDYRMRIYGADSYFSSFYNDGSTNWEADHDPCATGSWRHAHDYTVRVLEAPSCLTPSNVEVTYTGGTSATISWTSEATAWNMRVNGVDVNGVITNPYTLTGLELATTYEVEVQANCGANGLSEWSTPVSFTTDLCMPENMCEINYSFTDQYNDSWNGASIDIVDVLTSAVIENVTMPNVSSPYTGTVNVCNGRDIQFVWHSGSYDSECSYTFTDVNGEEIFSGSGAMSDPVNYTVNCTVNPCKTPKDLTVGTVESQSAELSWTGEMTTYNIRYRHPQTNPTAPATIILEANDVWGDGSGYQMLLDADATAYGTLWNAQHNIFVDGVQYSGGDIPATYYDEFEYKVPTEADGSLSTTNVVVTGTVTITIPAGIYDYVFLNPTPGDKFYVAADNGNVGGAEDNFVFEPGVTYHFTMQQIDGTTGDGAMLTVTPMSDWVVVENVTSTSYTLTGLTPLSMYECQVKGFSSECTEGTEWSESVTFTTDVPSFTKSINANNWYALSSPVNTPNVTDVNNLTVGTYDFYRYNEVTSTWENYKAHSSSNFTTFENGRGYIYRRSNTATLTFTGVPNTATDYPYLLTAEGSGDLAGFNLLGNPYATDYNYSGVCYNLTEKGTWKVNATGYDIPVCEAILIKVESETPCSFTSSKSAPKAAEALAFTVKGNGYEDVTYAMLEDGKGLNKVAHLADEAPALSIPVDGSNYAIAYLGYEVESFPLTLNATAGEYTIALNNQISGLSYCHLLDKVTGKETDLLKGAYTFKANGNSDRFTVLLNASLENGEIAIWNGNSWIVNGEGTLQVFDVMGRRVYNQEVAGQSSLNTDELATGVYVIRLGEKSQKIVVK